MRGGAAHRPRDTVSIVLYSVIAISVVVALGGIVYVAGESNVAPPPMPTASSSPAARPEQSVDLSSISPRKAADRLFNRVMAADEQGNMQEARKFAPMALQAYERVAVLDADAQFHIGLIHVVAGDADGVRRQAEILRQYSPDHLLAFILENDAAELSGDLFAAARASTAFAAAHATEIMSQRPEYQAHQRSIANFSAKASGGEAAAANPAPAAAQDRGAALFAGKCAQCHGPNAEGGGKGPPLVHKIYEPSHHGDDAFYRAVHEGVSSHHWPFGDMPPVPGVSDAEIGQIVAHVRALQVAKGIR